MPKFLMGSIVLLLLLGAGYGITTLQARSIPWDCSDWQAFAHADRTTVHPRVPGGEPGQDPLLRR